jgi:hypothetical protein
MTVDTIREVFTSRLKSIAEKFIDIYNLDAIVPSVIA